MAYTSTNFYCFYKGIRSVKMASRAFDSIPLVDVDKKGIFKYVLIKIYGNEDCAETSEKLVVRGYSDCQFHCKRFISWLFRGQY